MSLPLQGIRVIEMGQLIAIPHAAKLLADMGAEVIRIESCVRPDGYRSSSFYANEPGDAYWNRAANFYEQNRNKKSLALDLTKPEGLQSLKDLIAISDVFAENFTPRVMRNFGLEYEDLRKIKPDIIVVSSTGYGFTGPWGTLGAIGYTTESASGLASITGYEGGPPMIPEIPYADYTAAEHTVFAVVSALIERLESGLGQFIDVSQTETLSSTTPEALMDFAANGRTAERIGNRHPTLAPQGCYKCQGADDWIAISVTSDAEWLGLCEVLGLSDAVTRYPTNEARHQNQDAIDDVISNATASWNHYKLMEALQKSGVPAGAVLNGKELLFDPHLSSRGFYETQSHHDSTGIPPLPYTSRPWRFSETPAEKPTSAPLLGEHNELVLNAILGKHLNEIRDMQSNGVIGTEFANPRAPSSVPLVDQKRLGRIIDFDDDYLEQLGRR